ncbi:MAG: molybdopterin molybdenumtransferase MoeA, partial [Pedobacter sp.]
MMTTAQLRAAIEQRISTYNQNDFPLALRATLSCALLESQNHILAENVLSPFDIPRQNISAMDGYAIARHTELSKDSSIEIIGESQAGNAYSGEINVGQGVRIFTGAVVPTSCNTVVMQENTNFANIKGSVDKSQPYQIMLSKTAEVDANIRKQGEEIQQAEEVLLVGKRINPADISLMANLGISHVRVFKPLVVGLLATGDELVALGSELQSLAQIYNSNTPTLK